ncbi:MAG: DUF2272 domain-containing protein [Clostridia bacterium]|nr:DUF2272 domain-containing protein [Clostridia bacterium]
MKANGFCLRWLSALAAILICCAVFITGASALTPSTRVSANYKTGRFYSNLTSLELTGDQPTDVAMVAMSQLGYHEGNGTYDFNGSNTKGSGNYVEYNYAFGTIDAKYGYAWCAAFVSWCMRQAGVDDSVVKSYLSCSNWITWFKQSSTYKTRSSGHMPSLGDVIFFKDAYVNRASSHVGIVLYTDGSKVYTVEGNTSGEVGIRSYRLNDSYIVGYGIPDYKENEDRRIDYSASNSGGGDYVTDTELNFRSGPATSYAMIGSLPRGTMVEVEEIDNGWGRITYKGQKGWISMKHVHLVAYDKFVISYDARGGEFSGADQTVREGQSISLSTAIPVLEGHVFKGWASVSDDSIVYFPGQTHTLNGNLELYAVWEKAVYTVEFRNYDGSIIESVRLEYMESINPPTSPHREQDEKYFYVFVGWDELPTAATGDATVTALFEAYELPKAPSIHETVHMTDVTDALTDPDERLSTEPEVQATQETRPVSVTAGIIGCSISIAMLTIFFLALVNKRSA